MSGPPSQCQQTGHILTKCNQNYFVILYIYIIFQFLCGPEPISLVSGPGPQSWFCLCSNGFENDCNFVGSAS